MQPFSGNQRPDLLTSLMNMSLALRCHGKCIFADPVQMSHACHRFWKCHKTLTFCSFEKVHNPLRLPRETTSERPKVVRTPGVFNMLTSKCASCHNGVHFFDISISKSGPDLVCLAHLTSKCASRHNSVQFCISHLARWLHTRRFSEPTFRPCGATNHWKNTVFRDFPTFSCTFIFLLLTLSLL